MNIDLPFTPSDHIYLFYNSETNISRAGQLIVRPGSIVHLDCIQVSKKIIRFLFSSLKFYLPRKKNCILIIKITILFIKIHKISIFLILILILSSSLPKSYFPARQRSSQFYISSFHISAPPICVSLCLWHSFLSFSLSLHLTLSHISAPPSMSLSFIWFKSNPIGSVPPLLDKVVSSIVFVILQLGPVGPPQNKPFSNSMEASRSLAMAIGLKMVSFLITQLGPGGQWQLSF